MPEKATIYRGSLRNNRKFDFNLFKNKKNHIIKIWNTLIFDLNR